MKSSLAVLVALVLATSACGGSSSKAARLREPERSATTTTSAEDGNAPTLTPAPASGDQPASGPTQSSVRGATTPSSLPDERTVPSLPPQDPSKPTLVITAQVERTCVRPGGRQTITIRTEPDSGVGYDTVYSDGRQGLMEGHYGGNNGGAVDEDGTYTDTWTITPNAPAGKVQVNVLGAKLDYNAGQTTLYFTVATPTELCD